MLLYSRSVLLQYEMLREKELQQKTEIPVGYGRGISPMLQESRLDNYSPMSDSSMSIHLPDDVRTWGRMINTDQ